MNKFTRALIAITAAWLLSLPAHAVSDSSPTDRSSADDRGDSHRMREGSRLVDEVGEFRETGGRIAFYAETSNNSLVVLENLALERVSRELDQGKRKWSITGRVTEFRGSNYLLLERVVLKSRSWTNTAAPRS